MESNVRNLCITQVVILGVKGLKITSVLPARLRFVVGENLFTEFVHKLVKTKVYLSGDTQTLIATINTMPVLPSILHVSQSLCIVTKRAPD